MTDKTFQPQVVPQFNSQNMELNPPPPIAPSPIYPSPINPSPINPNPIIPITPVIPPTIIPDLPIIPIVDDPIFSQQWHLQNFEAGEFDLNIVDVWTDYTGTGIQIAVIDDAVERDHPDLQANYSIAKDWDFEDGDTDASPSQNGIDINGRSRDSHGTAVAGIIGASANNGIAGVGVAYDSTIFGFKGLSTQNITDSINNASGQQQTSGRNREADVVNISLETPQGIFFDQRRDYSQLNTAIDDAVELGRDGRGTILVKSAGNRRLVWRNNSDGIRELVDDTFDTNASSWNANPHTISVAAVRRDGFVDRYSTHGASVLVSAFGTPGEVVTTDRTGGEGYTRSKSQATDDDSELDYTESFNGTSAAAPMVSGVVALMLEANPNLGWRDVQEILAYSARHVGVEVGENVEDDDTVSWDQYDWSFNGADNWNGGGLHFSNDYGFGLVDAKAAVRLAETWNGVAQTSANDTSFSVDLLDESTTVSNQTSGTSFSQFVTTDMRVEHVEVDIKFTQWDDLGDLELHLTSPDGTTSILIDNTGEDNGNSSGGFGEGRWQFFSNQFRGEYTPGTWKVDLFDEDSSTISPIVVNDIDITFLGDTPSERKTFIFTEEFSDYAGGPNHGTEFIGGNGQDAINASAVDSDTTIDLSTLSGTIDGVSINLTNIETIVTGDGNDSIIGDFRDNYLRGMRGDDVMRGGASDDIVVGGQGNDELNGDAGFDRLRGGQGNDSLKGGHGTDMLTGTNSLLQGAGEIDIINPGDYGAVDYITLGDTKSSYYVGKGTDYAVIEKFDRFNSSGETDSDKLIIHGDWQDYTLTSFTGEVSGVSINNGTKINQSAGEIVAYVDSSGLLTASDFSTATIGL